TSPSPMAPASSPPLSWSRPSAGEMVTACCWVNDSGSAPNFSLSARSLALCSVKLPLTEVAPGMASWISGAEITLSSSTNATWLPGALGVLLALCSAVYFDHLACPLDFRLIPTVQSNRLLLASGAWATALATSVPGNSDLSRMYLTLPSRSQAAIGLFGSLATTAVLVQSSAVSTASWSGVAPGYLAAGPVGGLGGTRGVPVGVLLVVVFGVLAGVPVGASPTGGTTRPAGEEVAVPVGEP